MSSVPPDLVLFDLDGTLSDPLEGIGRSINHALAHFGYAERPLDALAWCIGPPLVDSFPVLAGRDDPAHTEALIDKYRERYGSVGYAENLLYPGIAGLLERLSGAGVPMALCTSKRADFAERILEHFGLRAHFRFISGGSGTPKWQQMGALRERGLVSERSLMVGDRSFDMVAAHRNGLTAAGVLWGYGSAQELAAEAPRHLCATPAELGAVILG
ncbi:MAG: HAD hydrolase-like protein [Candidatus Dactylopiibacterium sp.]|nr:HAD hydrolase-like protein [Candidatus Dactylopiibacterium sp.]